MASCNCGCRKATVYLQIGCGQATETALPRRHSICGKRSEAEYTKKPSQCKQVCRKAHLYLKISHDKTPSALPRRYSICGKRSEAEYTKKPLQCKRVCRKHTYISKYHMTRHRLRSAEVLQYMRQAKRSRIYEEAGRCVIIANCCVIFGIRAKSFTSVNSCRPHPQCLAFC